MFIMHGYLNQGLMADYSCNSRECDGRVFESQPNTARCIHCGSDDIKRLDRPWLLPAFLLSVVVFAVGALGWWLVALDEQGRESLRNFQLSGCKDMTACNFTPAALMDDAASCTYDDEIRDCNGTCKNDADGDGVCDSQEIFGCIDEAACNYDKNATEEELICKYPEPGYTCSGDCVKDRDGDGICDESEVLGCTDPAACNFDADATEPDGSCWYREVGKSCEESTEYTRIPFDEVRSTISDYYESVMDGNWPDLSRLYANRLSRFFDERDISRNDAIASAKSYDREVGVVSKRHVIRWETLQASSVSANTQVNFTLDYYLIRDKQPDERHYVLDITMLLDENGKIAGVWE